MKQLSLALVASCLLGLSGLGHAASVMGKVEGVGAGLRLSLWTVSPYGQPLQELGSVALGDTFTLPLPSGTPSASAPLDGNLAWPGLIDFEKASTSARAAEAKFFVYRDENKNGTRQDTEALREVRLSAGKGDLFVVWASSPVTVSGGRGYQANLNAGWNTLVVDVRNTVTVKPWDGKTPLTLKLGNE